jgi:hypothetical protein
MRTEQATRDDRSIDAPYRAAGLPLESLAEARADHREARASLLRQAAWLVPLLLAATGWLIHAGYVEHRIDVANRALRSAERAGEAPAGDDLGEYFARREERVGVHLAWGAATLLLALPGFFNGLSVLWSRKRRARLIQHLPGARALIAGAFLMPPIGTIAGAALSIRHAQTHSLGSEVEGILGALLYYVILPALALVVSILVPGIYLVVLSTVARARAFRDAREAVRAAERTSRAVADPRL